LNEYIKRAPEGKLLNSFQIIRIHIYVTSYAYNRNREKIFTEYHVDNENIIFRLNRLGGLTKINWFPFTPYPPLWHTSHSCITK